MVIRFLLMCGLMVLFVYGEPLKAEQQAQTHISLEAAAVVLHLIDWRQTRYIAKNQNKFYELNPILGKHPSTKEVDRFFIGTALLGVGLYHFFPEYRKEGLMFYIGLQSINTIRNASIGIKIVY